MDHLRKVADEMTAEENELLAQRDQRAKATAQFAHSAMLLGGLLVLALVSIVGHSDPAFHHASRWPRSCNLWGGWARAI